MFVSYGKACYDWPRVKKSARAAASMIKVLIQPPRLSQRLLTHSPISKSFRQASSYLSLSRSVALNDGQDQMRGVRAVMIDAVDRLHKIPLCFRLNRSAGVRIAIKAWEVAAGHL